MLRNEKVQQLKDILTAREAERAADAAARGVNDPDPSPGGVSVVETPESVEPVELPSGSNAEGSPADTMQTVPMTEQAWPPRPWFPRSNLLRWTRTMRTVGPQEHGSFEKSVRMAAQYFCCVPWDPFRQDPVGHCEDPVPLQACWCWIHNDFL